MSDTVDQPHLIQHTVAPHPVLAARLADRQLAHRAIMAAHSDSSLGPEPRARAQCLWHYEEHNGMLIVQSAATVRPEVLGEPRAMTQVRFPGPGESLRVTIAVAIQKSPMVKIPDELRRVLKAEGGGCYRPRLVVVPEAERFGWFANRLAQRGFAVDPGSLELSPLTYADLGRRGGGIPYVEAVCDGQVTDAPAFAAAIRAGIGKGRNFGLGLFRLRQV
ncbi:MAG: type I-E CRISPR-associated protein Cas6/Cse3/CasE [Propionibacteriaceae bacterium]|nr:type I-E CRISPR-associated protein Cas6/Cse3/CasE [Propionibacteriaceae bacterium]